MEVAELRNDQKEGVKIGPLLEILLLSMCGWGGMKQHPKELVLMLKS